jgi:hypothetical protein
MIGKELRFVFIAFGYGIAVSKWWPNRMLAISSSLNKFSGGATDVTSFR